MICVIPSAGRAGQVTTQKLFPDAFICVPDSQGDAYRKHHKNIVTHPDDIYGMGQKRQWILENFHEEIIFQADDDLTALVFQGHRDINYLKIKDPEHIWEVVLNTAHIARDTGTNLFGFAEMPDRRKFDYISPFNTRARINGFQMGVINDKTHGFDPRLVVKQDYDFYLMSLFWKRFVWRDDRYSFIAKHYTNTGGLFTHRSTIKEKQCIKVLQQKFGRKVVTTVKDKPWKVVINTNLPPKA